MEKQIKKIADELQQIRKELQQIRIELQKMNDSKFVQVGNIAVKFPADEVSNDSK